MAAPFLSDIPAVEALATWLAAVPRVDAVELGLADALGRVTAEPIWALRSSPAYDAAAMDGIAVRAADTVGATETSPRTITAYELVDTGDALPEGFDAVVMREQVHWDEGLPEVRAAAAPWQHVRTIGEDVSATELLLPAGHRLRPVDLAAAGASGLTTLPVRRAPHVVVIPTGDEVRPLGSAPAPGELVDTNSVMLAAQAREAGCTVESLAVIPDDPALLEGAVHDAARRAELVIVIAGSSAGRDDHTAAVVAKAGTLLVHGVAVRPGHPVVLGTVDGTPVLGAPGYPVSAALTFDIFALPLLAAIEGAAPVERPRAHARLARRLASAMGADDWIRVRLGRVGGRLVATPLPRGAGVLTSLVRADGLLVVPSSSEGYDAGAEVEVQLLRDLGAIERTIVAIGSHDMVLDLAASLLRAHDPMQTLVSGAVGSLGGLVALRDGLCHVAGCHLLDPDTGVYTLPWIERVLPGVEVEVVRLVEREQGLIVRPGNPLGIRDLDDLTRVRYVNRQRGAGTRVLLDHRLAQAGIRPEAVDGYEREEPTHLAVAAAVAAGRVDAGMGIMAAARAFGLDFVPVAREPFDLVMHPGERAVTPLLALLDDEEFRAGVEALGGYSTAETGRRIV
ncbi:MAG TPA: molybdopterin biosynthesis protein [Solirubrobacteraceae bacterium]|nr:molybdopterin biosynthesis protein [Solirubrobacteraceae bacterium]